jgi:uncharacterized OB-fold protein
MALLSRDPQAPAAWQGQLPVTNRYTAGLAGECFFRALQERGAILGTRCPKCNRLYVPGTAFCERCLDGLKEWVDVGTVGEVHTFTLLYVNYDGSPRERPELVAFIRFGDGGLVHRLGEIEPEAVRIGMPVEAVFRPVDERTGSILDIEYFRPVEG